MKKQTKNIAASGRAKLQNIGTETNRPFSEVLQYYGMERFLYRLTQSEYANHFTLKGALLFTARGVTQRRTTLDIDFLSKSNHDSVELEEAFRKIDLISPIGGRFMRTLVRRFSGQS